MTNTNNENKNAVFSGNVYAELQPVKNLKLRTVFGAVYGSSEYRSFTPMYQFSIYSYNTYFCFTEYESQLGYDLD